MITGTQQMTYLLFIKRLDELQTLKGKKANRANHRVAAYAAR